MTVLRLTLRSARCVPLAICLWATHPTPAWTAERVVVLRNGNVFVGDVVEQEHQVTVATGRQRIVFDAREVDMIIPSLVEAYRRKAARLTPANAHGRAKLIAWCIQQQLNDEARQQLEILRRDHPTFPGLDLWQSRIESGTASPGKTVLPTKAPWHPDLQLVIDVRKQLTKQSQSQFVRSIQPILLNRCAQADCHGRATTNNFRLVSGRSPLSRTLTQRNLGATLRQIGDADPNLSMLWMSATEDHGGAKKSPLSRAELDQLLGWILLVHRDLSGGLLAAGPPTSSEARDVDPFDPSEFNSQTNLAPQTAPIVEQ